MSISQMTMDFFPFKYICCSFLTDKLLTSMFSLYNVQCLNINRNCSLSSTWFTRSVLSGTETDGTDPWRAHGSPTVFYQEQKLMELILGEHMVHLLCFTRNRNWSFASTWFTRSALSGTGTDPSRANGSHAVFYQERNWSFASTWFTRSVFVESVSFFVVCLVVLLLLFSFCVVCPSVFSVVHLNNINCS